MTWEFKRTEAAPGGGFFHTDGMYAENFMAGVRLGTQTA